jgi:hypothetical protein
MSLLKIGVQYQYFSSIRNYFFPDGEYNYTVHPSVTRVERSSFDNLQQLFSVPLSLQPSATLWRWLERTCGSTSLKGQQSLASTRRPCRPYLQSEARMVIRLYLGMAGLYRGFGISLLLNLIQAPVVLSTYEYLKSQKDTGAISGSLASIPLPYIAGVCSSVILHPLDSLRKMGMLSAFGVKNKNTKIKTYTALKSQLSHQGLPALYSGFTLTVFRNILWLLVIYGRHSDAYRQLEAL